MYGSVTIVMAFHVLGAVFWAGSSFVVARFGGLDTRRVFGAQAGAAAVTILTGGYLWNAFHRGAFGKAEQVLAIGIVAAGIALALQLAAFFYLGRTRATGRVAALHYPAAGLLAIAVLGMAIARVV